MERGGRVEVEGGMLHLFVDCIWFFWLLVLWYCSFPFEKTESERMTPPFSMQRQEQRISHKKLTSTAFTSQSSASNTRTKRPSSKKRATPTRSP